MVFDLFVATFCFLLAGYGSYQDLGPASFSGFLHMRVSVINLFIFSIFLLAWHISFALFGLYRSKRLSSAIHEVMDVLKATFAGGVILFLIGRILWLNMITLHFMALFLVASALTTLIFRLALRFLLRKIRSMGRNQRHLLIVGTNQRAVEYARKIESRPELGYRVDGFVENGWSGNNDFYKSGYSIVASFKTFSDFIRSHVVDEVMICLPMKSHYEQSLEIVKSCEAQGIIVRFLSDFFDLQLARSRAETLVGDSVITLKTGAINDSALMVKRGIDILFSSILLMVTSPLLAGIALLIKLTSPGPVFFVQKRVGLNKRNFKLYKFRTMVCDAEKLQKQLAHLNEVSGPVFKIKNDPRITPIGKYLRKTSLDELPQLLNVLKGDMSLVGPRPPIPSEVVKYDLPYLRRLSTKPGITCLWQVSGRNSIPFDKWMELDQQYIDQWSLWMDVKILAKTVVTVLRGSGS